MAKVTCKNCGDIVDSPCASGRMVSCKCFNDNKGRGFALDDLGCNQVQVSGNWDDIEWINENKKRGIK